MQGYDNHVTRLIRHYHHLEYGPSPPVGLRDRDLRITAAACLGGLPQVPRGAALWAPLGCGDSWNWPLEQRFTGSQRWTRAANLALTATALGAFLTLGTSGLRNTFLKGMVWIGVVIAVAGVLAYWTSPGEILWIFPTSYPDNWGPFPSRNNFAQFLELFFP